MQEATRKAPPKSVPCPKCNGTGLVCAHKPVIEPGACCVDFGNAICPECGGSGKAPANQSTPERG